MAEQQQHHHHHHSHSHKPDEATLFKRKSLAWIQRRKLIERVLKRIVIVIAIIMVLAVIGVYTFG